MLRLNSIDKSKCQKCTLLFLVLVAASVLTCALGCPKKAAKSAGRILSIDLPKRRFRPGETLTVYVKVRNDGERKAHFLVALNVLYGDETIYDSHHGKKSHDHKGDECLDTWVEAGAEEKVGSFVYRIPDGASSGTYHVLAGLREYPWEPLLEFRGARWCPPETTFEVRK